MIPRHRMLGPDVLQAVRQSPPGCLHTAQQSCSVPPTLNPETHMLRCCCAGYEHEDHAAEAHDVAALRCKGTKAKTNFPESRCAALRAACLAAANPATLHPAR